LSNCATAFIDAADETFTRITKKRAKLFRCRDNIVAYDIGSARQFFFQLLVSASNGRTDALSMADHGFAFIAKIADERTDTDFVVAISAFKLIDLGLNKRLKFNSACECTLNAFVHRSNFATNSLAQCGYTITGGSF